MSTEEKDTGGTVWDDPNRQAVGLDPAWVEGTGGGEEGEGGGTGEGGGEVPLEDMTKADLLAKAQGMGVSPANNDMTKAELIDGIRAAGG